MTSRTACLSCANPSVPDLIFSNDTLYGAPRAGPLSPYAKGTPELGTRQLAALSTPQTLLKSLKPANTKSVYPTLTVPPHEDHRKAFALVCPDRWARWACNATNMAWGPSWFYEICDYKLLPSWQSISCVCVSPSPMRTNSEYIFIYIDSCLSLNPSAPPDHAGELKRGHPLTIPGCLHIKWDLYFLFYVKIFISLGALLLLYYFFLKVGKCF